MDQDNMLDKMYGIEFDLEARDKGTMKFSHDVKNTDIHICEVCLSGIEKLRSNIRNA
jgi:hypothetical protein